MTDSTERKDYPEQHHPSPELMDKLVADSLAEKASLDEEQARDQQRGEALLRGEFLGHCDDMARYWANQPDLTPYERTSGVVFSILSTLDGTNCDLPAFDIISAANTDIGNVCVEEGTVISHTRNLRNEYTHIQTLRMEAAEQQVTSDE